MEKGKTSKKSPKNTSKKVEKKEMAKYSVAALSFIVFFGLYFTLINLIIAGLKMLVA